MTFVRKWQRDQTFRGEIVSDAPMNRGRVPEGGWRIVSFKSGLRNSGTDFRVYRNGTKIATCYKQEQAKLLVALLDAGVPDGVLLGSNTTITEKLINAWWAFKISRKTVDQLAEELKA